MREKEIRIGVIPIGDVPEIAAKAVAAHISGYLNLKVDLLSVLGNPSYAFDERRLQYNAGLILDALEKEAFHNHSKIIGVIDLDIFVPIFTHVLGEAKQGGRCALVSLNRLREDLDGASPHISQVLERAGKIALHEIGHVFNVHHCMDEGCLMHFSGEVQELDQTPLHFCRYCSVYFKDAIDK